MHQLELSEIFFVALINTIQC